ncbi:MAG: diacylglycerol kinase family protein [Verrucomicrobiota bacterium]
MPDPPTFRSRPRRVHVIINPAPLKRLPLLSILNDAFRAAGIAWDVSLTHATGDGLRLAREALTREIDAMIVYGGDGTVMEVASALVGLEVPLLILAGGTGNLVAAEMRLPSQVEKCLDLLEGEKFATRSIDVGMMGETPFLLRLGCGIEVGVVQDATRELKNQWGKWAYVFAGIKQLQETPEADYRLTMDGGRVVEATGVACVVANVGTVGVGKLTLAPSVAANDGQLDVFLLKKANIEGILQLASKMVGLDKFVEETVPRLDVSSQVTHWSVESVKIETEPVLDIQVDGDVIAETPQAIRILPRSLEVIVPFHSRDAN